MAAKKRNTYLMLAAFVVIAAGLYIFNSEETPAPEIHGIYLEETRPLVTFSLRDSDEQSFTDQSFLGQWSLVFFGFTYCPDICPLTLAMLNQVVTMIEEEPRIPTPQIVFVSVDPDRDTPELIANYVHYFNEDFIGVTGNDTQLTNFSRQLGTIYEKVYLDDGHDGYLVDHSGSIALINPNAEMQAVFTTPLDPMNIAQDYASIIYYLGANVGS